MTADALRADTLVQDADATAADRRAPLLDAMARAAQAGVTCAGCAGTCCTFVANSMQITPLEALDIVADLRRRGEDLQLVKARLQVSIVRDRLDVPVPGTGSRALVRRRYTCPFFAGGPLGCTVTATHKPYGCLGFNPRRPGIVQGEDCGNDDAVLATARTNAESQAPRAAAAFAFEKAPIPVAVLAVLDALAGGPRNP